jgi:hypothetical protein
VTPLLALALVPLALVAGTIALVVARARALRRPLESPVPDEPLTADELSTVERWESRLRSAVSLVLTAYLVALVVALSDGARSLISPTMALFALGLACLVGAAVQFSARCPRCGFNLGFQSRLLVPEQCERCGASYRSTPTEP